MTIRQFCQPLALVWANCAQSTTASVGTYWDNGSQLAWIGLGTGIGGFVNSYDPCPMAFGKTITTTINNNPANVTSWTELQYQYGAAVTSSGVINLAWNATTTSSLQASIPVPPGLGSYIVSASLDQALDPNGNILATISATSGSIGYESPVYYLLGPATYSNTTQASFISNPLFVTGNLNYIVTINYASSYL